MSITSLLSQTAPFSPVGIAVGLLGAFTSHSRRRAEKRYEEAVRQSNINEAKRWESVMLSGLAGKRSTTQGNTILKEAQAIRNKQVEKALLSVGVADSGLVDRNSLVLTADTQLGYDLGIIDDNEATILNNIRLQEEEVRHRTNSIISQNQGGRISRSNSILQIGQDFLSGYITGDQWARGF